MKPSGRTYSFLIIALGLALMPAPVDATCGMIPSSESAPCNTAPDDSCCESACDSEQDRGDDRGCRPGCLHCSLPCCSGTAMISTEVLAMGPSPILGDLLAVTALDALRGEAELPDHPPQG
jgi:hypothetical protein